MHDAADRAANGEAFDIAFLLAGNSTVQHALQLNRNSTLPMQEVPRSIFADMLQQLWTSGRQSGWLATCFQRFCCCCCLRAA
jgi:hypothetical protein